MRGKAKERVRGGMKKKLHKTDVVEKTFLTLPPRRFVLIVCVCVCVLFFFQLSVLRHLRHPERSGREAHRLRRRGRRGELGGLQVHREVRERERES